MSSQFIKGYLTLYWQQQGGFLGFLEIHIPGIQHITLEDIKKFSPYTTSHFPCLAKRTTEVFLVNCCSQHSLLPSCRTQNPVTLLYAAERQSKRKKDSTLGKIFLKDYISVSTWTGYLHLSMPTYSVKYSITPSPAAAIILRLIFNLPKYLSLAPFLCPFSSLCWKKLYWNKFSHKKCEKFSPDYWGTFVSTFTNLGLSCKSLLPFTLSLLFTCVLQSIHS